MASSVVTSTESSRITIDLREYGHPKEIQLSEQDYYILQKEFKEAIDIRPTQPGSSVYKVSATHYVGFIVLSNCTLIIQPKIESMAFPFMLNYAYGLEPRTYQEDYDYAEQKEWQHYHLLIKYFLSKVEKLCKRGISKGYYEMEENIGFIKGRILVSQTLAKNCFLSNRIYCRYSEFGPDNLENRIIKYALYLLSRTYPVDNSNVHHHIRHLFHYFEAVELTVFSPNTIPTIYYNRLIKHYEPIIEICKLIINASTIKLDKQGRIRFASFLLDTNQLFERFLVGVLQSRLSKKEIQVHGGDNKDVVLVTKETKKEIILDVSLTKNGQRLLVIDAKYKKGETVNPDLYQLWTYCIALSLPFAILVYPKHELTDEIAHPKFSLVNQDVYVLVKTIDLKQSNSDLFEKELDRFSNEIFEAIVNKV